ncbi:MAG TPA: DNA polymerase III subunit gamma/tau, partial [Anaerolineales bacterium]|nr:DNA polymerase III subunit gamma/tau [Anaerolineales bacterium]
MAQALYRKWRPRTFEEVVGQEHVVRTLRNALTSGRIHHAYLFAGPRGTGKTTTARLLAKAVNCLAEEPEDRPCNECAICQAINEGRLMDLIEIDAASNTGVDDVRELRERVGYRPNEARYKVYVIDEVHMLSNAAFNALLKTLEEPPPHAIFVLATTEPHRIPPTVLSRCQRFDFRRIPLDAIIGRLHHLAEEEGIGADPEALTLIARQATGSMRDAESLLDQLAAYNEGGITVDVVRTALGTGEEEAVMALTDALAAGDVARGLAVINESVDRGADPRQFARQVVEHLRGLLLARLGSDTTPLHVPDGLREAFRGQAARFSPRELARAVRLFNQAAREARAAWQPQLPLELAFVEAVLPAKEGVTPSGGP